jgi:RimJ/RimL family protein N-acetyltransferase
MPDLRLREVIESDLPIFFNQQLDDVANHMAAFTPKDPADRDAFDDRWRRIFADATLIKRTILHRGEVVGSVSCHRWFGDPEITYWVARPHWGKGIATAALSMFLEQVSERPLFARAAVDNMVSISSASSPMLAAKRSTRRCSDLARLDRVTHARVIESRPAEGGWAS